MLLKPKVVVFNSDYSTAAAAVATTTTATTIMNRKYMGKKTNLKNTCIKLPNFGLYREAKV